MSINFSSTNMDLVILPVQSIFTSLFELFEENLVSDVRIKYMANANTHEKNIKEI